MPFMAFQTGIHVWKNKKRFVILSCSQKMKKVSILVSSNHSYCNINLKSGVAVILKYYSRVPNKRACTRYLILYKLPLCTVGSARLFIFWIFKRIFEKYILKILIKTGKMLHLQTLKILLIDLSTWIIEYVVKHFSSPFQW